MWWKYIFTTRSVGLWNPGKNGDYQTEPDPVRLLLCKAQAAAELFWPELWGAGSPRPEISAETSRASPALQLYPVNWRCAGQCSVKTWWLVSRDGEGILQGSNKGRILRGGGSCFRQIWPDPYRSRSWHWLWLQGRKPRTVSTSSSLRAGRGCWWSPSCPGWTSRTGEPWWARAVWPPSPGRTTLTSTGTPQRCWRTMAGPWRG